MSTVSCNLMGGLGNMLFQIATAYSVSIRDNKKFICDINNMVIPHRPYSEYKENIFRKVEFSENVKYESIIRESGFNYSPIPQTDTSVKLSGYFQTERYFENYRNEILKLFEIDEKTKFYLNQKYLDLFQKKTCSIHVRRGDYMKLQKYHPILPIDYFKEGIKIIGEEKHYLIFSDDIDWCIQNFEFIPNKTFITKNLDYQDLYLMSMLNDNIIANSSFSWWGAWMNENPNKRVIAPIKWFGEFYSKNDTTDLYPKNWIKI